MNTWAFVVGVNWAAADLLRYIRLVRQASTNSEKLVQLGSCGAAFNVAFWGLFHAVIQLIFTLFLARNLEQVKRRVWALLASAILPLIALSAASFQLSPVLTDSIPALYWHEMDHQAHRDLFGFTANSSIFLLPGFLIFAYLKGEKYLSCPPIATIRSVISKAWNSLPGSNLFWNTLTGSRLVYVYIPLFIMSFFIGIVIYAFTANVLWFVALGLPLVLFNIGAFAIIGPLLWLIWILNSSIGYTLEGYGRHNLRVSESCFFMPCAPQFITDEDQLYSVVVGLISLLIFDVGPTVHKKYKVYRLTRGIPVTVSGV
jgi:hypothetical protein